MSAFSSSAFSTGAFSTGAYDFGSSPTPTPTPTLDTHDGFIPEYARKFYESERLKHSKVIRSYETALEAEPEILSDIVSEFSSDTSKLTTSLLREIAQDKAAMARLLTAISAIETRMEKQRQDSEDDELLIMLAAVV
jgi:hypothetical protein